MSSEQKEFQKEISLLEIGYIFLNHIWFIIITTISFFVLISIYAWFIVTPDYISNADVMVQVEQDASSTSDPNFDLVNAFRLIDTVAELMEKEVVLINAIERLENKEYKNLSVKYLRDGLKVTSSSTSYFINISFVDVDPKFSEDAVDAVIEAVIEETDIADAFPVLTNKIRRTSFANEARYNSPNKLLFSIMGIGLGLFLSLIIVISKEVLSTHFKSKDEIENTLGLQVLGIIPSMNFKEKKNGKK